jgi:hypothetical protein
MMRGGMFFFLENLRYPPPPPPTHPEKNAHGTSEAWIGVHWPPVLLFLKPKDCQFSISKNQKNSLADAKL